MFEGLPGVFGDSLPDGWGRLLVDRAARSQGILPEQISPLDRLCYVGNTGMGALVYEPDHGSSAEIEPVDLDQLAESARYILNGDTSELLDLLIQLNGSSAGARPKVMVGVDLTKAQLIHSRNDLPDEYEPWLIKFSNTHDGDDAGIIEYLYSLMAREAGLEIPETHLFMSRKGARFFGTRRFDRVPGGRLHLHSAAGLLNADFRLPTLDYHDLAVLTLHLTRDIREVERLVHLAVFNVLAHNRDDHAKNFSYLMDENGSWRLSPAYDLTFSGGPNGEQSMLVMGEGIKPTEQNLIALGTEMNIRTETVKFMIDRTRQALRRWPELASAYGVRKQNAEAIHKTLGI
jgi:serine/threonine-protein kinase HipA